MVLGRTAGIGYARWCDRRCSWGPVARSVSSCSANRTPKTRSLARRAMCSPFRRSAHSLSQFRGGGFFLTQSLPVQGDVQTTKVDSRGPFTGVDGRFPVPGSPSGRCARDRMAASTPTVSYRTVRWCRPAAHQTIPLSRNTAVDTAAYGVDVTSPSLQTTDLGRGTASRGAVRCRIRG